MLMVFDNARDRWEQAKSNTQLAYKNKMGFYNIRNKKCILQAEDNPEAARLL